MIRARCVLAIVVLAVPLSGCGTDECGEGLGADGTVASAERWLVLAPSSLDAIELPDDAGDIIVTVEAASVDVRGRIGTFGRNEVPMHPSELSSLKSALAQGSTVYLALSSTGLDRELIAYGLARSADGSYRIVGGDCAVRFTETLRGNLGERFDARMSRIIGKTERIQIEALLQP